MKIYENIPKNLILENFNKKLHDRLIELGCKPLWAAKVEPDQIVIEQGLYPREQTDWEQVEIYKEDMLKGDQFPTVIITAKDGQYILVDGNHRVWAGKKANKKINTEFWDIPEHLIEYVATIANTLGRGKQGKDLTGKVKKKEIIKAYEKGINRNIKQLAEDFETTEGYIKKVLSEAGLIKDEKQKLKEKAFELREQGYTQQEIANELGVSDRTIRNWFSEKEEKNYHGKKLDTPTPVEDFPKFEEHDWINENVAKFTEVKNATLEDYAKFTQVKNAYPEDFSKFSQLKNEKNEEEPQTEPDWSDWNEEQATEESQEKPKKKNKKDKLSEYLTPTQLLERRKNDIWDIVIELEFHFGTDTALEILEEIYFAFKEKKYKDMEIYKDRKALFLYNRR